MITINRYHLILTVISIAFIGYSTSLLAQKHGHSGAKIKTVKDSIKLQTHVLFTHEPVAVKNEKTTYADVVKFDLEITNGSSAAIPDPLAYHGAQYIKFYINGKLHNPKVLYNEQDERLKPKSKFIASGASQTFYCDWLRQSSSSLLKKYGKKFTVQWSYVNVRSKKVVVDMVKRTAALSK